MAPKRKAEGDQQREKKRSRPSSSEDHITMFRQMEQSDQADFKRNVQRCSHIAIDGKKGYYTHHMLVTEVYKKAVKVIEYGSPIDLKSVTSSALAMYLGIISEREITFDKLFSTESSKVFLVYCDYYPRTNEEQNAAIQRAKSRLGEKQYCPTYNNCEHFVTWALTGTPICLQWKDASRVQRFGVDFFTTIVSDGSSILKLLLQKYLPNELFEMLSQYLSNIKEKCLKYLQEASVSDWLRSCISSIRELDVLLVIIFSLLKFVVVCVQEGHSPGGYIWEIIKIVALQIRSLQSVINSQLFEIPEKFMLWKHNLISTVDLFREIFKIILSCFAIYVLPLSLPASFPFFIQILGNSVITAVLKSAAGFAFDIVHLYYQTYCYDDGF